MEEEDTLRKPGSIVVMIVLGFLISFTLTSLLGYWIHRVFHRNWAGKAYESHLNHHLTQYPPGKFLSSFYRDAGKDNTAYLFWIAAIPIVFTLVLLFVLKVIALSALIIICVGIASAGFLHDYFHDQIHISPCYWERYSAFRRMRDIHQVHHRNLQKNFGIMFFVWDRIFSTFKDTKKEST